MTPNDAAGPTGLRLHDLAGLVVGYGLAAVLVRSFWQGLEVMTVVGLVCLATFYGWLGLAMSGPVVFLLDRRGPAPPDLVPSTEAPSRYSGAEMAWIGIGGYFIAVTLFVVPARHQETPWTTILIMQILAGAILWRPIVRRSQPVGATSPRRWTRAAARVLLLTWPLAWLLLATLLH